MSSFLNWGEAIAEVLKLLDQVGALALASWIPLAGGTAALGAVLVAIEYLRWRRGWLSWLIELKLREIRAEKNRTKKRRPRHFSLGSSVWLGKTLLFRQIQNCARYLSVSRSQLKDLYLPSSASFVVVVAFLAAIFSVPYIFGIADPGKPFSFKSLWDKDNIKKVFEGLIVVAVGLIIFVAESIRESKDDERKRALLKISYLWPFTLAITLFPIGYLAGESALAAAIVVALVFFAVYAFGAILRNLLDADAQSRGLRELLKARVHSFIMSSVRERVGNNILLEKLGSGREIKINYTPSRGWLQSGQQNYAFVDYPKPGWLSDINITELRAIADLLQSHARKHGFELSEGGNTVIGASNRTPDVSASQTQDVQFRKVYLLKKFGEQIYKESLFAASGQTVLAIHKDLASDERLLAAIRQRVSQTFRLTKTEPGSFAFRREMQRTKDQLIASIRSKALGAVAELSQTYLEVAEEFLETLNQLGGSYTAEQAEKERGNIFAGWNEIGWLSTDLRELLPLAAESDNIDIIGDIAFLPFAIGTRAVIASDHLLFQEFIPFASQIYYLAAQKSEGSPVRNFMSDRAWRYLKEICEFYILPIGLEVGGKPVDFIQAKDFALFSFKVFQDILKAAYDADDIKTFEKVLEQMRELFAYINPSEDPRSSEILKLLIQHAQDEADKEILREELIAQQVKEDAFEEIIIGREVALFGFASYLLERCALEPKTAKNRKFYHAIESYLPTNLIRLTSIFDKAKSTRLSYLNWTRWDIHPEGKAYFVDSDSKPNRLYWLRALKILAASANGKASKPLPLGEAVRTLLPQSGDRGLPAVIAPLDQDENQGKFLGAEEISKTEIFRELLRDAVRRAALRDEDEVINAPLDTGKLTAFYRNVVISRGEHSRLRPLLKAAGSLIEHKTPAGKKLQSWGFNQLDDKGAFVLNSRVSFPSWGEGYGRGLARSEDKLGFEKMLRWASKKIEVNAPELIEAIKQTVEEENFRNPIILHSLLMFFERLSFRDDNPFFSKYRKDCPNTEFSQLPGFTGVLKLADRNIPINAVFVEQSELRGHLLIADLDRFARWQQFPAVDEPGEEQFLHDSLFIRVADLNVDDALRKKILEDNPEYLHDQPDKERYLRTRVVVKVFEKFSFDVVDNSAGTAIRVHDNK